MGRSLGFGSYTCNFIALLTLGFPSAPMLQHINLATYKYSPDRSTKSTISHHYCALSACKYRVSGSFHSPPGVLFTFPSQYFFTIGHQVVFRLGGWSPRLPGKFLVFAGTLDTDSCSAFSRTGLSPSLVGLSSAILLHSFNHVCSPNPATLALRFGLFPFRSPLLRKSIFLSLPPPT